LVYTLNDIEDGRKNLDILMTAWSDGDSKIMEKMMFDPLKEDRQLSRIYEKAIL